MTTGHSEQEMKMEETAGHSTRFLHPDCHLSTRATPTPRLEISLLCSLPGVGNASRCIGSAFGEIDFFAASLTDVRLIEFVREDLLLHSTSGALAGKGLEFLKMFQTGTMHWCRHKRLLFSVLPLSEWLL
jgi:hypothetical protein